MKLKTLHEKSIEDLNNERINLFREQFKLRIQSASIRQKQSHLLKQVRRNIARIKTLLTKKEKK